MEAEPVPHAAAEYRRCQSTPAPRPAAGRARLRGRPRTTPLKKLATPAFRFNSAREALTPPPPHSRRRGPPGTARSAAATTSAALRVTTPSRHRHPSPTAATQGPRRRHSCRDPRPSPAAALRGRLPAPGQGRCADNRQGQWFDVGARRSLIWPAIGSRRSSRSAIVPVVSWPSAPDWLVWMRLRFPPKNLDVDARRDRPRRAGRSCPISGRRTCLTGLCSDRSMP
jgi:hypothetical protein